MSQRKYVLSSLLAAGAVSVGLAMPTQGAIIEVTPHAADGRLQGSPGAATGTVNTTTTRLFEFAGQSGTNYYNTIYVFELPALAAGQVIESANLRLYVDQIGPGTGGDAHLDLYGLGYRDAPDMLASDWYGGGELDPNATLLQASLATPDTEEPTFLNTDDAGDSALGAFIQAQYDAGASAGDFLFLRLNTDAVGASRYYRLRMVETDVAEQRPQLTLNVVPEPASLALLGLGGLAALGRTRTRRV